MQLGRLDHVNIRTSQLDEMVTWYTTVLGMENGDRPPFPFPGAWLYADGHPFVHLIGVEQEPRSLEPKLEHFAFSGTGLTGFMERLDAAGIDYEPVRVPGIHVLQINLLDCDGNHIHIDFSPEEADTAGL